MAEEQEETTEKTGVTPDEGAADAEPVTENEPETPAEESPKPQTPTENASQPDAAPEAPAAPSQAAPAEVVPPKERKRRAKAAKAAKAPAAKPRSPEERQEERVAERRRKAGLRRAGRVKERAKARAGEHQAAVTQAREHVPGTQKTRQGIVVSNKADKTITVRIDIQRRHRKYQKIVATSTKVHAHDERNDANEGDTVIVRECRPLSRSKRWRLVEVVERAQ
jgi:small subunit ribosomal protein S17